MNGLITIYAIGAILNAIAAVLMYLAQLGSNLIDTRCAKFWYWFCATIATALSFGAWIIGILALGIITLCDYRINRDEEDL